MKTAKHRHLLALFALWSIVTALNLFKPVHIDDTAYLETARHIAAHPLHPMSGSLNWEGARDPIHKATMPHLFLYLLAAVMKIFGESEVALHALVALFSGGCILLYHAIAVRLKVAQPLLLTALCFVSPAFIPSQNIMLEVPLLFSCLLFFYGIFSESRGGRVLSGAAAAAACLTKYNGAFLVPVLAIEILRRRRYKELLILLVPVAALGLWSLFNYWDYGGIHLLSTSQHPNKLALFERVGLRSLEWILTLGAVAPFALLLLAKVGRNRWVQRGGIAVAAVLLGLFAYFFYLRDEKSLYEGLRAVDVTIGFVLFCTLAVMIYREFKARSSQGITLALWSGAALLIICLISPFMAVRHLLNFIPAFLLLVGRQFLPHAGRKLQFATLALSIFMGVGLGMEDWHYAAAFPEAATALSKTPHPNQTVWFAGHWGWQWYAAKAGLKQLDAANPAFNAGDTLIIAKVDVGQLPHNLGHYLDPPQTVAKPAGLLEAIRTVGPSSNYYSCSLDRIPWSVSFKPLTQFQIYPIKKSYWERDKKLVASEQ